MNYKIAAATLVLACAFGSAGCSHNAGDQQAGPVSGTSAQQPQTSPYASTGTAASAGAAGTAAMAGTPGTSGSMGMTGAAPPSASFDQLAGSKGYITQEDARHDSWLSEHFSGCDSNNDGKLTRQEYAQCMQKNGSAAEGVPTATSTH